MSTTNTITWPAQRTRRLGLRRVPQLVVRSVGVLAALAFIGCGGAQTCTLETHLHNIFREIDVASRVELARAVERVAYGARNFGLVALGRGHVDQGRLF